MMGDASAHNHKREHNLEIIATQIPRSKVASVEQVRT